MRVMETFYAIIFALDLATSNVKLVLEVNKAFSTCYKTVCVWKREMLGGFEVGQQVNKTCDNCQGTL